MKDASPEPEADPSSGQPLRDGNKKGEERTQDYYRQLFDLVLGQDPGTSEANTVTSDPPSSGRGIWAPPSVEEIRALLPQLKVEELIGSGGMGAVYRGRQASLDRTVAIKLLPKDLLDPGNEYRLAERFGLEAKSLAKLDHPNIVSVYDFGETSAGHLYFVMEFVDGTDLGRLLSKDWERPGSEDVRSILSQTLDALSFAHENGIIHRDIKPGNILIDQNGRVKIADFGIAKSIREDTSYSGLTVTGAAIGTPDYMAPEAHESFCDLDHRADIYACGVVLYQMLTGVLPRGKFGLPTDLRPDLDQRFNTLIENALESNPLMRIQSALEFKKRLSEIMGAPEEESDESDATRNQLPANGTETKQRSVYLRLALGVGMAIVGGALLVSIPKFTQTGSDSDKETKDQDLQVSSLQQVEQILPVPIPGENDELLSWTGARVQIAHTTESLDPTKMGALLKQLDGAVEHLEATFGIKQVPIYEVHASSEVGAGGFLWGPKQVKVAPARLETLLQEFGQENHFPDLQLEQLGCFYFPERILERFASPDLRKRISRNPFSGMVIAGLVEAAEDGAILLKPGVDEFKKQLSAVVLQYENEAPDLEWAWFERGQHGFDQKFLTAGILLQIRDEYADEAFLERWFQDEIAQLEPAETRQEMLDAFYATTCRAAGRDLHHFLVEKMGLKVSRETLSEIRSSSGE